MVLVVVIIITLMGSAQGIRATNQITGLPPPDYCCLYDPFCCVEQLAFCYNKQQHEQFGDVFLGGGVLHRLKIFPMG
ncbi:hypothetical protein Lal_00030947 [Lupinus albus]|nr:hypothetical protein Lal_00030947 [Lupinus albus]